MRSILKTCEKRRADSRTRPAARARRNDLARRILAEGRKIERAGCPACGQTARAAGGFDAPLYRFDRCGGCGALYAREIPDAATLERLYRSEGEQDAWRAATPAKAEASAADRELLADLARGGFSLAGKRLLDVGCGAGGLLRAARDAGMQPAGLEVNPETARSTRGLGFEVHEGTVEDYDGEPGSFDAVTLNQVLEHLADPAAVVRRLGALLRPGGRLVFATPHAGSRSIRIFGARHVHVFSFAHLQLFSLGAIDALARGAGLSVVHAASDGSVDVVPDDLVCVPLGLGEHRASYVPLASVPLEIALRIARRTFDAPARVAARNEGSYVTAVLEKR
jgi:2-polyprenyl-3-methyl-5-hydroxy-6-metoxy-1,4-benzoquinol methylase